MDVESLVGVDASVVTAIATIVLAVLTGFYVRLTYALVKEAKLAKFPNVYVDIEIRDEYISFIVGNAGSTPARNIRFKVKDNFPWHGTKGFESGIESISAVKDGISYLAPGRILKYDAGFISRDPSSFTEGNNIEIHLTFETELGTVQKREFSIELRSYHRVLLESFTHPEREIAMAIRDVNRNRSFHESLTQRFMHSAKKVCPICGENIPSKAKKCPRCLEFLPAEQETND